MLIGAFNRLHMIHMLPRPAEVAEIGVCEGDFSERIFELCEPRRLHLIDPWEHQGEADYARDPANLASGDQEQRHARVLARLAAPLADGRAVLHRMRSSVACDRFADGQFDWVFVDGNHTFDGALSDLRNYAPKIAADGMFLCHDHSNSLVARDLRFGVVEAVAAFCAETGWCAVALSAETCPTMALARDPEGAAARRLRAGLILNFPGVVEVNGYPGRLAFEHRVVAIGGERRLVPTFAPARSAP